MVTGYRAFSFRTVGASHIKSEKVCQDYTLSGESKDFRYAVVCDGHGGDDYFRSERGSRFAAEVFEKLIVNRDFLCAIYGCADEKKRDEVVLQLVKSLIFRWNALIDEDMKHEPFSKDELDIVSEKARKKYENGERVQSAYGTTLIGAVVTDDFWFGLQIGDGKCVCVSETGDFSQPIPWDDNCFLNVTTSLCDENAAAEFRFIYSETLPTAIFIGSDGIDDSFAGDEKLNDFYRVILKSFAESDEEAACKDLEEYLPTLSAKGSGDDMSVAMILNTEYIKANPALFQKSEKFYLSITRSGDLGGDNPNDRYFQQAEVEAVPGKYSLNDLGCYGFRCGVDEFEILTADANGVVLRVEDKTYAVTESNPVEIPQKDRQTSYDGPSWTAEDELEFKLIRK